MQFTSFQIQAKPGIQPQAALARLKRLDTILCDRQGIGLVTRHASDPSSFHGHHGIYEVRIFCSDSYDEIRALQVARGWANLLDFELVSEPVTGREPSTGNGAEAAPSAKPQRRVTVLKGALP